MDYKCGPLLPATGCGDLGPPESLREHQPVTVDDHSLLTLMCQMVFDATEDGVECSSRVFQISSGSMASSSWSSIHAPLLPFLASDVPQKGAKEILLLLTNHDVTDGGTSKAMDEKTWSSIAKRTVSSTL